MPNLGYMGLIGSKGYSGSSSSSSSPNSGRSLNSGLVKEKVKVKAMASMGYHGGTSSSHVPPMVHLHGTASIAGPDSKQVRHAANVVDLIIVNSPKDTPTSAKLLNSILPLVKVDTSRRSSRLVNSKDISELVKATTTVYINKVFSVLVKATTTVYINKGFLNKVFSVLVKATTTVYIMGITVMSKDKVTLLAKAFRFLLILQLPHCH